MTRGKQHYVPRSYLENFAFPSKSGSEYQVFAFDQKTFKVFNPNIKNMPAEKGFYDFPTEVVREEYREFFDNWLTPIDGRTARLPNIVDSKVFKLINSNKKKVYNKKIKINKEEWSKFLIIQYLRTLKTRNSLVEMQSKFFNFLNKTTLKKNIYVTPKMLELLQYRDVPKLEQTQKQYQLDLLYVSAHLLSSFLEKHQWEIGVNLTETLLYTSDNPVATIPNFKTIYDLEEIEILFPVNSRLILILKSGKYPRKNTKDCLTVRLGTQEVLEYNKAQIFSSNMHIFCQEKQFEFAEEVCKKREYYCSKSNNLVIIKK